MKKSKAMTAVVVEGYEAWIRLIKERIQRARIKASMLVNSEQTLLYWDIGYDILEKQNHEGCQGGGSDVRRFDILCRGDKV